MEGRFEKYSLVSVCLSHRGGLRLRGDLSLQDTNSGYFSEAVEDAMVAAAKQIKAANPATSVAVWFDTILVYTGCERDS